MKKIVSILLTAVLLASAALLTGCGDSKAILESSKEDKTVIGSVAGLDVPLEIYRYVALNYRRDYENGDGGVWIGDGSEELYEKLKKAVDDTVVGMYTTLAMAKDYGIDPDDSYFVDTTDTKMTEIYKSYGSYRTYADEIAKYNMNDAVYRFIVRDELLAEEILVKMIENGEIERYSDSFREIAESDTFVRIKQILISSTNGKSDEENLSKIKEVRAKLDKGEDFDSLVGEYNEDIYMFGNSDGYYIARGSFYPEFEDAAFSLSVGETSDIIKTDAGYCILMRCEKEDAFIEKNLTDMYVTYRDGLYNLALEAKKRTLSVEWNEKAEKYTIFNLDTKK